MSDEYYLTDNIRLINNDAMEYRRDGQENFQLIKKHNWHHV